jgi:hypothetical protein
MIYAGIDVNVITHEKALAAGIEAFGLWAWGMCYAQLHETDGRLPRIVVLSALAGRRNVMLAQRLVAAGLWTENEDGSWQVYNYRKKNQSSEEIRRKKEAAAERARAWRERVRTRDVTRDERVRADPSPEPSPSSPPPPPPENKTDQAIKLPLDVPDEPKANSRKRGTRIPEGWRPSEETEDWSRKQGVDPVRLVDEFHDYWRAVPGAKGVKLDWDATFRNRVRDVAQRGSGKRADTRQPLRNPEQADWLKASGGDL